MDIRPDHANVMIGAQWNEVDPEDVETGTVILIKPGERVPLDGTVLDGVSALDTSSITGEPIPRAVSAGSAVYGGCINLNGVLTVRTDREYGQSAAARILDLVENAGARKASMESFITRFARYYTPAVVGLAVILAVIPPLVFPDAALIDWIRRALTFLVISCPCALVISVPLTFFGGLGGASANGVLVKGGNFFEALANAEIVVLDKTGTLTQGVFEVTEIEPIGLSVDELLELAALAESRSSHPIALSLLKAYGKTPDPERVCKVFETPGFGVEAEVDGDIVLAGSRRLIMEKTGAIIKEDSPGSVVHMSKNGEYLGHISISDKIKDTAAAAIAGLKGIGVKKTAMLTGDSAVIGKIIADQLGVDKVFSELLPSGKVDELEQLLLEKSPKGRLVFVGDGINDAPVLARADVGVAMGALGSEAAVEAADVVIMDDDPARLITAIKIAKRTVRIASQNVIFALTVKFLILILGAFGFAGMQAAVFADVGVAVIAILNAMRALTLSKG
jgi:Cd2+/Zn2+-exporting ATPase